jgi:hypothetical protein
MTISILLKHGKQQVARPWNRASNTDEAIEMLVNFRKANGSSDKIFMGKMDTDTPVLQFDAFTFYAFTESNS